MFFNSSVAQPTALPGSESERVRARYLGGKGKGPHYYKGIGTGYRYKVVYGGEYMVDPSDVVTEQHQVGLGRGRSLLLALEEVKPAEDDTFRAPEEAPAESGEEVVERTARVDVERTPVTDDTEQEELPNLYDMTVWDVEQMEDLTPDMARKLIRLEEKGKDRVGVRKHLEKFIEHG